MLRLLLVVLVISHFIVGCAQIRPVTILDPTAPCDQIVHPALLTLPYEELAKGRKETEEWILTQFPTSTVEFQSTQGNTVGDNGWFTWSENHRDFTLTNLPGVVKVEQGFEQHATLGDVLSCYGDPTYYILEWDVRVSVEAEGDILALLYPDRGLYIWTILWGVTRPHRFDATSVISGPVWVSPAGTVDVLLRAWYIDDEEEIQRQLALLQEWPENFTKFVSEQ